MTPTALVALAQVGGEVCDHRVPGAGLGLHPQEASATEGETVDEGVEGLPGETEKHPTSSSVM